MTLHFENISKQIERINFAQHIKSPFKKMLFLADVNYKCGSDYSKDYLEKEIGELEEKYNIEICDKIEDQGFRWGVNDIDDQIMQDCIDEEKGV